MVASEIVLGGQSASKSCSSVSALLASEMVLRHQRHGEPDARLGAYGVDCRLIKLNLADAESHFDISWTGDEADGVAEIRAETGVLPTQMLDVGADQDARKGNWDNQQG